MRIRTCHTSLVIYLEPAETLAIDESFPSLIDFVSVLKNHEETESAVGTLEDL